MSSFIECESRLWDDSGLADALERGTVYAEAIDARLRDLHSVLRRIDGNASPGNILASPHMKRARILAKEILTDLSRFGYERGDPAPDQSREPFGE